MHPDAKIIPNFREILNEILPLKIASQSEIIYAMNRANNPSSLDEIINLLLDQSYASWMQIDVDDEDDTFHDFDDEKEDLEAQQFEQESDVLPNEEAPQQQAPQHFAWKCHRCDTWYMSWESEFCLSCVPFKQQDASIVTPGPFTYRPAFMREKVVRGYLLRLKNECKLLHVHLGVDFASHLVLQYLCLPMYDRWQYLLTRRHRHGKDLCINHWNQRAQFRGDHSEWRSVFGTQTVSMAMCVRYTLIAVTPIKSLFIGLVPSQQVTEENCARGISKFCISDGMVHKMTVEADDVIEIKVDLKATPMSITFFQQKYEIKSVTIDEDKLDGGGNMPLILSASFQEKYAAVEMAEFEAF
eukprot:CAMPEP_0202708616 /NCGR_PEP_ID=MMETSP1385-20130828/20783_1 /ASSEMBLY_ACC=CAM_ASM_000861 /TAXON_ID=933848 /ORGANISM="Elphidium margaritaceum" /LENGTH=355 /DNA_ID=CAMNT_0049367635 /DNA_START=65 /DNA_END=1132 /DNA_ORIENTATION=+